MNKFCFKKKMIKVLHVVLIFLMLVPTMTFRVKANEVISDMKIVETKYHWSWKSNALPNGFVSSFSKLQRFYADGELVFCVDPTVVVIPGGGYEAKVYRDEDVQKELARTYVANDIANANDEIFAAFQMYIHIQMYKDYNLRLNYTNLPNPEAYFEEFERNTEAYWSAPTFNVSDGVVADGEVYEFPITNGEKSDWVVHTSSEGVEATFLNDRLIVKSENILEDEIFIELQKDLGDLKGPNMIYQKPNAQTMMKYRVEDTSSTKVVIPNTHTGNLRITKKNSIDGNVLQDAKIRISYHDDLDENGFLSYPIDTKITDTDGKVFFEELQVGQDIYYQEIEAPKGYILDTNVYKTKVTKATNEQHIYTDVEFGNEPIPNIETYASGVNGEKEFDPTLPNELKDQIYVENINTDKTYTIVSKLWRYDEVGEHELMEERYYEDITFTQSDGVYEVDFPVEGNRLESGRYFFSEDLYVEGKEEILVTHEDAENEKQTIYMIEKEYDLRVKKIDSETKEQIEVSGIEFEVLCYKDGIVKDKKILSSEEGIASFIFQGEGTYDFFEIKELKAPKDYVLSNVVVKVLIEDFDENGLYEIVYENTKESIPIETGYTPSNKLYIVLFMISTLSLMTVLTIRKRS